MYRQDEVYENELDVRFFFISPMEHSSFGLHFVQNQIFYCLTQYRTRNSLESFFLHSLNDEMRGRLRDLVQKAPDRFRFDEDAQAPHPSSVIEGLALIFHQLEDEQHHGNGVAVCFGGRCDVDLLMNVFPVEFTSKDDGFCSCEGSYVVFPRSDE